MLCRLSYRQNCTKFTAYFSFSLEMSRKIEKGLKKLVLTCQIEIEVLVESSSPGLHLAAVQTSGVRAQGGAPGHNGIWYITPGDIGTTLVHGREGCRYSWGHWYNIGTWEGGV